MVSTFVQMSNSHYLQCQITAANLWYNPAKKDNVITESSQDFTDLTPKEKRAMTLGVLASALEIGLLFSLVFFLFILFFTKVWFA